MEEIRLNSTESVLSVNKEAVSQIQLNQTTKKLPLTDISTQIDQYEVYRSEASACTDYRLTLTVKPYCTNVLFNACTEIVRHNGGFEDGDTNTKIEVALDNKTFKLSSSNDTNNIKGKVDGLDRCYMVKNTEYSSEKIGFEYYPGLDIFNNHILRNLTFRSVIPHKQQNSSPIFNTLEDTMRRLDGNIIKFCPRTSQNDTTFKNKHLYSKTDVLSMEDGESIDVNLTRENGWFGFYNNSAIESKRIDNKKVEIHDSAHVINNKGNCDFVDMYPDRTLYSFTPKFNPYKRRLEKNWDVYITYPYENFYSHNLVTNTYVYDVESEQAQPMPADGKTNGLLVMEAKYQQLRNGIEGIQFRSYCKHNLQANDYIIIYFSFDEGNTFIQCETPFRVTYTGDMKGEKSDYYFCLNNTAILPEILKDYIADVFYDVAPTMPSPSKIVNNKISDIPEEIGEDTAYIPDIVLFYYERKQFEPQTTWDDDNTVDDFPQDAENGPVYIRQRVKYNDEYVYTYYVYSNGLYQMVPNGFDPTTEEFGAGNTFDDIPSGKTTDYIRVHDFTYYQKERKYYTQKRDKTVAEIINEQFSENIQIRFAKIDGNIKCDYYIRKFKKLPNLNHTKEDLTYKTARDKVDFETYILQNASKNGKMRDFENEVYPLAFAKTIYGDDITQYQYTENLKIDKIRDNLGRPLTEAYITVVKKNVGYKEWYEKQRFSDYQEGDKLHRVEYSHCFGKVTSGFEYLVDKNDDLTENRLKRAFLSDVTILTNVENRDIIKAIPLEIWETGDFSGNTEGITEEDEIFWGDVVEYNPSTAMETVISNANYRFNTAQREIGKFSEYKFEYDEIEIDDFDEKDFHVEPYPCEECLIRPEGYYYNPHYRIGLRQLGENVKQASHHTINVISAEPRQIDGIFIRLETANNHGFGTGRKLFICNDAEGIWYESTIVYVDSKKSFLIEPINKHIEASSGKPYLSWIQTCELINERKLTIRIANENIPDYAYNAGVNMFIWRDIVAASESNDEEINTYPFANGALYIDKSINLFLKRQDPEDINNLLYTGKFPDTEGKIELPSNYEYIPERDSIC